MPRHAWELMTSWDLWFHGGFFGTVKIGPFSNYNSRKLEKSSRKRYSEIKIVVQYIEAKVGKWNAYDNMHKRIGEALPHERTCLGLFRTYDYDSNRNSVGSWYKVISQINKRNKKKIKRKRKATKPKKPQKQKSRRKLAI